MDEFRAGTAAGKDVLKGEMMDYKKFAAGLRSAAGSYALFYGAPRGDLEKAADVIEELAARLESSSTQLTLEELRGMDGEPVWVVALDGGVNRWAFVASDCEVVRFYTTRRGVACNVIARCFKTYGRTWLAYRRRPEEAHS